MKRNKILFLSVASALLLAIVAFGIQACDLNGDGFDGGSSSGNNNSSEEQLSALFQKWQGEGKMTFTNREASYIFTIEFIDGNGIQLTQTRSDQSGTNTRMRAFKFDTSYKLDIKSTADIDVFYTRANVGTAEGEYNKEFFSFQLSDTELTLNIVGNSDSSITSQHIVTFRSDGSYKFLVLLATGTSAPVKPNEAQTAFNIDTNKANTGWSLIFPYTKE